MAAFDPWIVLPFSRPEMLLNVQRNLDRQSEKVRVLLVANKRGKTLPWQTGGLITHVIHSDGETAGCVKNDGLRWLRDTMGDDVYVISMDDDDIYGRSYVQEHLTLAMRGIAWCKKGFWAQLDSGLSFFPGNYEPGDVVEENPNGATLGFYLSDVGWYDGSVPVAEEPALTFDMRARGGTVRNMLRGGFCVNRLHPERHTWQASEAKFRRYMGVGIRVAAWHPLEVIDACAYGPGTFV